MLIKKLSAVLAAVCIGVSCLSGCNKNSGNKNNSAPQTEQEWRQAMIEKSIYSYGNTSRMKNKIKQAQSGEKTTVAYIGGSITEGLTAGANDCYAKLTYEYFAEKFGNGENVEYVNAGLSGTPSKLGVLRLSRDVLQYEPDIVFIEFAVNDGNDGLCQGSYESIVRRILSLENDVAVVLVMAIAEDGYTAQEFMKQIADYYQLPVISYADALTYMFENEKMTWDDFSDDSSHPNKNGHKLVSEMIRFYYDTVLEQPKSEQPEIPEQPLFSNRYDKAEILENTEITPVESGSFVSGTATSGFKNGWSYKKDSENSTAVFEIKGRHIFMIFREQPNGNLGVLDVTIKCDGEIVEQTQVNGIQASAWGDPGIAYLHTDSEVKDYTVEVKMAEGSEEKDFQILAFAVTTA